MSELSPSAIRTTKSLREKIAACTSEAEVQAALREEALAQRVVEPDWDETILNPTARADKQMGTTVTVNGVRYELVGTSEADLVAQENQIFRGLLQAQSAQAEQPEQPRDVREQFDAIGAQGEALEAEAARVADLESRFRSGQMSAADFISQSGVIEKRLAERAGEEIRAGWEQATQEFLNSPEGSNWPGSSMLPRISQIIAENGLENAGDKTAVLKEAWALIQKDEFESHVSEQVSSTNDRWELQRRLEGDRATDLWWR